VGLLRRRFLRWGVASLVLLLLLLGVGRMVQLHLESRLQGARGPYLQMPAADGMTIRWQTIAAEKGAVHFGTSPDRLDSLAEGPADKVHEVRLTGLKSDTVYYYRVGETVYPFRTSPLPGAERPVRLWVQGDPGVANPITMQGRDAAMQWAVAHPRDGLPPIDLWLTTGDNAYSSGKDREFQQHLFDAYPQLLPSVPYLPVYGNHDARRDTFYQLFSFPEKGEAGGIPSGSEHYFATDYGPVHLIFLDTSEGDLGAGGAMLQWLEKDLAATRQPWIIALQHHPAYTMGSHNSDNDADSGGRMHKVRENVLPLLERGGVDLALFGHSHVYERSHLMACHYGKSESFKAQFNRQQSSDGVYRKSLLRRPFEGTIYNVVGSSAHSDNGPLNHPAMAVAMSQPGSLMLDIAGSKLSAVFIAYSGALLDHYEIDKEEATSAGQYSCDMP
jgi:hypothetical protein